MLWHIRADQTHLRHINNIYKYLYLCRDCGFVQLLRPDTGRPYFVTLFVVTIKPTRLRPSFFPLLIVFRGLQNLAVSLTVQLFSFIIIFFELNWWRHTTCRNYLLISKAWKQRTKIRMGRLPFFVSADIQLIFFINNTDVTEWTTLLYVLWFIIISIFRRSESVLLICRYYHWDHG